MSEHNPEKKEHISSDNLQDNNIFEDFSQMSELSQEVEKLDAEEKKDMFFYIKHANTLMFVCNILLFLLIAFGAIYVYIQSQEEKRSYPLLSSVCQIFVGNISLPLGECYGVTPLLDEYQQKLENIKKQQAEKILPLLGEVYTIENFTLSPKVSFLLEKSTTRLKALDMLNSFDSLKNTFAPIDKKELRCYDIVLRDTNLMEVSCDAYSSDWDRSIVRLNENGGIETVDGGGTSVSRASSFIYFLENYPESRFVVLEKPDVLRQESVQELPYTQKTSINLLLRYYDDTSLSF